jgi:hypothetical protein
MKDLNGNSLAARSGASKGSCSLAARMSLTIVPVTAAAAS